MQQYRINVGDTTGQPTESYSDAEWSRAAQAAEERGYVARLQKRSVYKAGEFISAYPEDWLNVGGMMIEKKWRDMAVVDGRRVPKGEYC